MMTGIAGDYAAEAILFDDDMNFISEQRVTEQKFREQKFNAQKPDEHKELAQAYVPIQTMDRIFPPDKALTKGTVFPELYRPYHRCSGRWVYD